MLHFFILSIIPGFSFLGSTVSLGVVGGIVGGEITASLKSEGIPEVNIFDPSIYKEIK